MRRLVLRLRLMPEEITFSSSASLRLCARLSVCRSKHGCAFVVVPHGNAEETAVGPAVRDPTKIVGSDQCAKCHEKEVQQWMRTPHFATFDTLHRLPRGEGDRRPAWAWARSSGMTRVYAVPLHGAGPGRPGAGGGRRVVRIVPRRRRRIGSRSTPITAGRTRRRRRSRPSIASERLKASIAAGMNNPHNVYLIARQCYDCHTVPDESLVNVGRHVAGSQDFELVAWSQGIVRHNFLRTGGTANGAPSPAELRVMYVVGVLADLEYSLRAVATATRQGDVRRHKCPAGGADEAAAARDSATGRRSAA